VPQLTSDGPMSCVPVPCPCVSALWFVAVGDDKFFDPAGCPVVRRQADRCVVRVSGQKVSTY